MKVLTRCLGATSAALLCWSAPRPAHAWVDTHLVSDDIRVEIESAGTATINHVVRLKVQGGPLRWLDVPGIDRDATPLALATVTSERDGTKPEPLTATIRPDGSLRLAIDGARGISRGTFSFQFGYRTSSVDRQRLDGQRRALRLLFTGPTWPEGLDNARCTFVLPKGALDGASSTGAEGDAAESGSFLTTVRRGVDHDEIELLRPHVARMEAVPWTTFVHPNALGPEPEKHAAAGSTEDQTAGQRQPSRTAATWFYSLLFVGFSCLASAKAHAVTRLGKEAKAGPLPVISLPWAMRSLVSGGALAAGVAIQRFSGDPMWGTLLVLVTMLLCTYRPAPFRPEPKGEGRWLPLRDVDAFENIAPHNRDWLDASTRWGKISLALTVLAVLGVFRYLVSRVSYDAYLLLFDALIVVPIWFTGTRLALPPDPFSAPASRLSRLARRLRSQGLRTTAWARRPEGSRSFDDLRLLVTPRLPRPGFSGIEIGYTIDRGVGTAVLLPELLIRAVDGTTGHEALSQILRGFRWVRGRKPDERVALVRPRLPTLECTAALVRRLAEGARQPEPSAAERVARSAA